MSCRNYRPGDKWSFGRIKKRIGKLHYLIQLDNGQIWKRHINQMRLIGEHTPMRTGTSEQDDKYIDYNLEEQDSEETQEQPEIVNPTHTPQLRRSQRARAPPQRYGEYVEH